MDCGGSERDEAGTDMGVDSLKPNWVLLATLFFFTSSNHGLQRKGERKQKKGRAKNRSAILGLIIF